MLCGAIGIADMAFTVGPVDLNCTK